MREEIERVAYELYEKSGRVDGRCLENWLEAESHVVLRGLEKAKINASPEPFVAKRRTRKLSSKP